MVIRFIIGFALGVILTYSVFFGLQMLSLYENDIKQFFRKKKS